MLTRSLHMVKILVMNTPSTVDIHSVLISLLSKLLPVETDFIRGYYKYITVLQHYTVMYTEVDRKHLPTYLEGDIVM
jgi:hypothetical protein